MMGRMALLAVAAVLVAGAATALYGGDAESKLDELQRDIASDDAKVRHEALKKMAALGPKAAPAVPKLIEILKSHEDQESRGLAAVALGRINARSATDALTEVATSAADGELRSRAMYALIELNPHSHKTFELAEKLAKDPNARVRTAALYGLRQAIAFDDTALKIVLDAAAKDADPEVRARALRELRYTIPSETVYRQLVESASDPNEHVRAAAVWTLSEEIKQHGVDDAALFLFDPDADFAARTAFALGETGNDKLVPFLNQAAEEGKEKVKKAAAAALARIEEIKKQEAERRKKESEKTKTDKPQL